MNIKNKKKTKENFPHNPKSSVTYPVPDNMEITLKESERLNYGSVYLETLPELASAVGLYESLGFKMLKKPLGESGHFACNLWMLKEN